MFQTFKSTFGVFMYFVTCTPTDNNRTCLTINELQRLGDQRKTVRKIQRVRQKEDRKT